MRVSAVFAALSLGLLAAAGQVGAQAVKQAHNVAGGGEIPEVKPESVGFSSERLERLDSTMKSLVESKKVAGMVTESASANGEPKARPKPAEPTRKSSSTITPAPN